MRSNKKFALFLPGIKNETNKNVQIIAVDISESYTKVARFMTTEDEVHSSDEKNYITKDFPTFSELVNGFIKENNIQTPFRIAVAVPGPVINGKSTPERLPWALDASMIKNETSADQVFLINDLEASAYGLADVTDENLTVIHETSSFSKGNVAILAPGNGLGEAGLFFDGKSLRPFATEGGHSEFSPRTQDEIEFHQFLNKIYGIVSWETVLSKSGLFNIYRFLRDVKRQEEPAWMTKEIENKNFMEALTKGVLESNDRLCILTMETFLIFLAREANSLVLKLKATGGLILSGEIPVAIQTFLNKDTFYKNFITSDKMEAILENVPIYLLKNKNSVIEGAAYYAAFSEE